MAVVTDYTLTANEIILDLINQSQSPAGTLTADQVVFGAASVNATNPGVNGNTSLVVTGNVAGGFKGDVTVTYNRVAAADIPGARQTAFEKGAATQISDLLPAINARYGVNIAAADIVDAALPAVTDDPVAFNLAFQPGALVFVGTLALEVTPDAAELDTVITTTILDGLEYIPPTE